jgi:hypothetical protein
METKVSCETTKDLLLSTPIALETRTYKPVSHKQLVDLTLEGINKAGFELDKEIYSSAKEGNVAIGRYTIKDVADTEMQLQLTWRNSYDKSLPLVFSLGVSIKVCNNGLHKSLGMGSFKKKHQGEIQSFTPQAISQYIQGASNIFEQIQKERDQMKEISLTRTMQAEIVGKMFIEAEFIKSTQLNIIKRELDNPTYNYGDANSLWSLYQYTTFAMREIHPSLYLQDHLDAHKFFTSQIGGSMGVGSIKEHLIEDKRQLSLYDEFAKVEEV